MNRARTAAARAAESTSDIRRPVAVGAPAVPLPAALPHHAAPPIKTSRGEAKALQFPTLPTPFDLLTYQRDVLERTILFFDTLRRRANAMLDHEQAGLPPLLNFKSETLIDGRTLDRPANYALLRITEVGDDCWDDCVDPAKPPVIVLDPRAGHGPGIGGFKRDSEVGIALHTGHPVYFAVFFPEPCPGQTLGDVLAVLRAFVDAVSRRHQDTPPVLYGNCQAGWAATLLAADCQGLAGPVILNGSPLSYWAGAPGINPMRVAGGLVGGSWLTSYLADLNLDRFDGAWLVQNFEALKPGHALWGKYADLFHRIDTEADRFLDFERWWNGFYRLSGAEITAIVDNLFIGNKLEQGQIRIDEHCQIDLTAIRNPLVIFASYGDNITPPHQALGWIPAVYATTDALVAAGQRIIYLTNPHIGHLGIFVSAAVARFEHRAILEHLDDINALPPGLYEMSISNPTGDPDCARDQYAVAFQAQRIEALQFDYPREAFEQVQRLSERNAAVYRAVARPMVRAMTNPWLADALRWSHPMRLRTYLWSERFCPWMSAFGVLADAIATDRRALDTAHPLLAQERKLFDEIAGFWEAMRRLRDASQEHSFRTLFGG